jgi:hypothetical protein
MLIYAFVCYECPSRQCGARKLLYGYAQTTLPAIKGLPDNILFFSSCTLKKTITHLDFAEAVQEFS